MNIYFCANQRNIRSDIAKYREILNASRSLGLTLVNNWIESGSYNQPPYENPADWTNICLDARSGLDDANIVIAEASGPSSFGAGLEVGYAIAKQKKVILLVNKDSVNDSYVMGLDRQEVIIAVYDNSNIANKTRGSLKKVLGL